MAAAFEAPSRVAPANRVPGGELRVKIWTTDRDISRTDGIAWGRARIFVLANARSRPLSIYTLDNPCTPFSVSNTVDARRDADVNYFRGFSSEFPNHLRSSIKHCA